MSGSIVGGVIGAVIGYVVTGGNPMGAVRGFMIGSTAGALLFPSGANKPDLTDLKPQSSEYGRPIPIVYGTMALDGTIIWAADLIKTSDGSGGGKGSTSTTGPTYAANFAVMLCESLGSMTLGRIWAGPEKRLIYDPSTGKLESGSIHFYDGASDQMPDPLMESYLGAGNVPAYRGRVVLVVEGFDVTKNDGNRIPFLTVEVGRVASRSCPAPASTVGGVTVFDPPPVKIASLTESVGSLAYGRAFQDPLTGLIYYQFTSAGGDVMLGRVDPNLRTELSPLTLLASGSPGSGVQIAWNGNGLACAVIQNTGTYLPIDLGSWTLGLPVTIYGALPDGSAQIPIPLSDVAWDAVTDGGVFRFLSKENSLDFYPTAFAILATDDAAANAGYPYSLTFASAGSRTGGSLLSAGVDGVAGSFPVQPANFATEILDWEAYDSKRRRLVSFTKGAYSTLAGGGVYDYVNTSDFAVTASRLGVAYSVAQDRFFVHTSAGIRVYDPNRLTPTHWPPDDCIIFNTAYTQGYADGSAIPVNFRLQLFELPADPGYVGVLTGGGDVMKVAIGGNVTPQGVALSDVVADLSARGGLTSGEIDVTELTDTVDGYTVASQVQISEAIRALMPVYYFDAFEDQGKQVFRKRGHAIAAVIPDDDLGAAPFGSTDNAGADLISASRGTDDDLPGTVTVSYVLAATKYGIATKYARRLVGHSLNQTAMQLPMVLSDQKAAEVASVNLHDAWVGRISYAFALPLKYAYLAPTDLVGIQGRTMRLTKVTQRGNVFDCEAVFDDSDTYAPNVIVEETPPLSETVVEPSSTVFELM